MICHFTPREVQHLIGKISITNFNLKSCHGKMGLTLGHMFKKLGLNSECKPWPVRAFQELVILHQNMCNIHKFLNKLHKNNCRVSSTK